MNPATQERLHGGAQGEWRLGRAVLSDCKRYRYSLWRIWDEAEPCAVWIMLNPSTADERTDDATIRRCVGFSKRWGCGSLAVVNLFGLISTDPAMLTRWPNPVGTANDQLLRAVLTSPLQRGPVVCAWGGSVPGVLRSRVDDVRALLHVHGVDAQCLGRTKAGDPRHPVRLAYDTPLEKFPC